MLSCHDLGSLRKLPGLIWLALHHYHHNHDRVSSASVADLSVSERGGSRDDHSFAPDSSSWIRIPQLRGQCSTAEERHTLDLLVQRRLSGSLMDHGCNPLAGYVEEGHPGSKLEL